MSDDLEIKEPEDATLVDASYQTAKAIIGSITIIVALVGTIALAALIHGFVIMTLWEWFLIPIGLASIGLANAVGLGFFIRYLTWQPTFNSKGDKNKSDNKLVLIFVYPFVVLGLGWLAHAFM